MDVEALYASQQALVRDCAAVWTGAAIWGRVGPSKGPWSDGLGKGSYEGRR